MSQSVFKDINNRSTDELTTFISDCEATLSATNKATLKKAYTPMVEALPLACLLVKQWGKAAKYLAMSAQQRKSYPYLAILHAYGSGDVEQAHALLMAEIYAGRPELIRHLRNTKWLQDLLSSTKSQSVAATEFAFFANAASFNEVSPRPEYLAECILGNNYQPPTYSWHDQEYKKQLSLAFELRSPIRRTGLTQRDLVPNQPFVYGDMHVEGNLYLSHDMVVLGDLSVTGLLLVNGSLLLSGNLNCGAIMYADNLHANHVEAKEFIACFPSSRYQPNQPMNLMAESVDAPLVFANDKYKVDVAKTRLPLVITNWQDLPSSPDGELARLSPACFVGGTLSLHNIEKMACRGESVFVEKIGQPWHNHDNTFHHVVTVGSNIAINAGYLPHWLLQHKSVINELHLNGFQASLDGRLPDTLACYQNISSLKITKSTIKDVPSLILALPKLQKLSISQSPSAGNLYNLPELSAMVAYCHAANIQGEERKAVCELALKRPLSEDELDQYNDNLLLSAYAYAGGNVISKINQAWCDDYAVINSGDTISILGTPTTKLSELVDKLETVGMSVLVDEVNTKTNFIVLGKKPKVRAVKALEHARSIPKPPPFITETLCLKAAEPKMVASTEAISGLVTDGAYFNRLKVIVSGRFKTSKRDEIVSHLRSFGAFIRDDTWGTIDLAILGEGDAHMTEVARESAEIVWDEDRFFATLKAIEEHAPIQVEDPTQPALELNPSGRPFKLAGQPIQHFNNRPLLGGQLAYLLSSLESFDAFIGKKGIDTVQGLICDFGQSSLTNITDILVRNAPAMPQLTTLMVTGVNLEVDLCSVLDAYSNLETLWLVRQSDTPMEPIRHANLRQLQVSSGLGDGLTFCSFPQLQHLALGHHYPNLIKLLNPSLQQNQFSQLQHLSLQCHDEGPEILQALDLPELKSIGLQGIGANSPVQDATIQALLDLPIAKTLEKLSLQYVELKKPGVINSKNLPALTHLSMQRSSNPSGVCPYPRYVSKMQFEQGVHLDMRCSDLYSREARTLMNAMPKANVLSVNLDCNRIVSPEVQAMLEDLDIPVTFWKQGE